VVVLTGARQTGKTSTFRRLFSNHEFVSLDLPTEAEQAERHGVQPRGSGVAANYSHDAFSRRFSRKACCCSPGKQRLRTHPGVGPLTALAFVLIIGTTERFQCGKQIGCYLGLVPLEESSGERRRLGHITKQGNSVLRFLLVEAAQVTVRSIPEWRSKFFHLAMRRGRKIAKVAMGRRLAVCLYCPPRACGPRNLMKNTPSQRQNKRGSVR